MLVPIFKVRFLNLSRCAATVLVGLGLLGAGPAVHSLDLSLDARLGSEYTTNAGRSNTDELEEWVYKPGLFFRGEHEGPRYDLEANYSLYRRIHQQDAFDDETIVTGTGRLNLRAIPGLLDFTATNSRTETPIRSINSASPDNRQETSNTQAGPTVRFRVRGKDEVQFQYLYGTRTSERTENDADSHTGVLRYVLNATPRNQINLEWVKQEVQFENRAAPDLRSNALQARWLRQTDTLNWSLTAGYKETERSLGRDDIDAPVVQLDAQWQMAADTRFFIQASRDVRDQSEVLGFGSAEFGQRLRADSDLNEVFTSTRFYGGVSHKLGHTNFTLALLSFEEDYEDVLRDTDARGVILSANRRLNRLTTLDARLRFIRQDYSDQGVEFDQIGGSVLVTRRFSRRLTMAAGIDYDERDADHRLLQAFDYDEWLATLRVDYKLLQ